MNDPSPARASGAPEIVLRPAGPSRRLRVGFRFSLRFLLLATVLIAIGLGALGKKAREQRIAVDLVQSVGGTVVYHFKPDEEEKQRRYRESRERMNRGLSPVMYADEPSAPLWLRELLGEHWFVTVREVHLVGTSISDEQLRSIGRLPQLRVLRLYGHRQVTNGGIVGVLQVTDAGLAAVESLERLEHLDITMAPGLTDDGLKHLASLHRLKHLDLSRNRLTGAGLKHLRGLSQLTTLDLTDTEVAPDDLAQLAGLDQLESLRLDHLRCDRELLAQLQHFPRLKRLPEFSSDVGDAEMPLVARMHGLEHLDLTGTQVTDAGLVHLRDLTGLKILWLNSTRITDQGLQMLGSLPNLEEFQIVPAWEDRQPQSRIIINPEITDAGVERLLASARDLKKLDVCGVSITDLTLLRLERHSELTSLNIAGSTEVSEAAIERFRKALPWCRIFH